MASSKELQHSSRPVQHRLSMTTSTGSSLPSVRQPHARNHSHSVSSGSLNPSHRVSRRKSVTTNTSNVAALVAAVRESGDISAGIPITNRRNTMSKNAAARSAALGSLPSPPASLPGHRLAITVARKSDRDENAIEDDEEMEEDEEGGDSKARIRRASDGQPLVGGKKVNSNDLKCDKCGKGYKHSSCLTKHLWEHTPEWSYTSKLLISKHQQVQLLEAASVLVAMNQDGTSPPESTKDFQSDQESASPAASGSSDQHDRASSADTTPPPQESYNHFSSGSYSGRAKRYSSGSGFSRSYQSAASANTAYTASVPSGSGFGHHRQKSHERRPLSSGFNKTSQEDDQLAAAIDLLSCSFGSNGTPRTLPVTLPEDAPPVPNIPAHYLSGVSFSATPLEPAQHLRQTESYTRHRVHRDEDVKMEESEESVADDEDFDHYSRDRSAEDDDGVFGRMEE
ncbi:tat pathway signal sequence [Phlyctema vagabunda]|uniref:Tat pathway signal sequence n=1 Tax=Phlyctema vagabunda TaxID=108571 RepID=A0ABR4PL71_9HELO